MKIDIVIPTLNRKEKLTKCLDSVKLSIIDGVTVYVYFSYEKELKAFATTYDTCDWLNYICYPHTGDDFSATTLFNGHIKHMTADAMIYFNDDMEFEKGCIEEAKKAMMEHFPDFDGIIGFTTVNTIARPDRRMYIGKGEAHVDIALIGKKLAGNFPDHQFFCPDFRHHGVAIELLKTVTEWGKVHLSHACAIYHSTPVWAGGKNDATKQYVQDRYATDDEYVRVVRRDTGICWGLHDTLFRKEILGAR